MRINRGDIVLVDYLFSDRTGSKVRPCLVVQNDTDNQRLDDTIVAAISSNISRAAGRVTQVIISFANTEGQQSGLLFDSAVQCENLVTIDCQFIKRKVGSLSSTSMSEVNQALKAAGFNLTEHPPTKVGSPGLAPWHEDRPFGAGLL